MSWQKYISSLALIIASCATAESAYSLIASSSSSSTLAGISDFSAQTQLPSSPLEVSVKFPQVNDQGAPRTGGGGTRGGVQFPNVTDQGAPRTGGGGTRGVEFPEVTDQGMPRTAGAGVRSGGDSGDACASSNTVPLTALMPSPSNVGKTVSNNTALYWYVPESSATTGEFSLIDERGNEIYLVSFPIPEASGLVKLELPADLPMKVGEDYLWYFSLVCNSRDRSQDRYVDGLLKRTELSSPLKQQLQNANPLKQAEILAQYQIWHQTLSIVDSLRQENPSQWQELLLSVGLAGFAQEPITSLEVQPIVY